MTFDQHRSYFHDGELPGQPGQTPAPDGAPTATEIVAQAAGLLAVAISDAVFGRRMADAAQRHAAVMTAISQGVDPNPQVEVKPARRLCVDLIVEGRPVWNGYYEAGQHDQTFNVGAALADAGLGLPSPAAMVTLRVRPAGPFLSESP